MHIDTPRRPHAALIFLANLARRIGTILLDAYREPQVSRDPHTTPWILFVR